jgi:hypothetical protein
MEMEDGEIGRRLKISLPLKHTKNMKERRGS